MMDMIERFIRWQKDPRVGIAIILIFVGLCLFGALVDSPVWRGLASQPPTVASGHSASIWAALLAFGGVVGLIAMIPGLLILALLVTLIRYFWIKGTKEKG